MANYVFATAIGGFGGNDPNEIAFLAAIASNAQDRELVGELGQLLHSYAKWSFVPAPFEELCTTADWSVRRTEEFTRRVMSDSADRGAFIREARAFRAELDKDAVRLEALKSPYPFNPMPLRTPPEPIKRPPLPLASLETLSTSFGELHLEDPSLALIMTMLYHDAREPTLCHELCMLLHAYSRWTPREARPAGDEAWFQGRLADMCEPQGDAFQSYFAPELTARLRDLIGSLTADLESRIAAHRRS